MCREFHRVMAYEGPSHTTLFRYATGRVKQPNVLVERYVQQAIHRVTAELSPRKDSPRRTPPSLVVTKDKTGNLQFGNSLWTPVR